MKASSVQTPITADTRLPRYQQIRDDLAARIAASQWTPEMAIPTEAELTAAYDVSIGTLRKAIDLLVAEGFVVRSQGRGTFVRRPRFDSSLFRFFRFMSRNGEVVRPTGRVTQKLLKPPPAEIREALRLPIRQTALQLMRLRLVDQTPVLTEEIWLPLPRFAAISAFKIDQFEDLLYPLYERCCKQVVASAKEVLRVDSADETTAQALNIGHGSPVIRVQRLASDFAGEPIEWRKTLGSASDFEYQIELR